MPACTICGREVEFIPEYQQWYCRFCATYPYIQQMHAQQPVHHYHPVAQPMPMFQQPAPLLNGQPPMVGPTRISARSRIHSSISLRAGADRHISAAWVGAIIILQVIFPIMALATINWLVLGTYQITDPLMLFMLVLVIVMAMALVVLHGVLVYRLVARRDAHFKRDAILRAGMEEYLSALSLETRIDLNVERWTMNTMSIGSMDHERSPLTWAMLVSLIAIIPLVGIILLLYCQMFLTRDLQDHEDRQRAHLALFHMGLMKAGRSEQPLYNWKPLHKRDTAAYVILTILTLGFFLPYWWYVNINDMNEHFNAQQAFEDLLVQMLKSDG